MKKADQYAVSATYVSPVHSSSYLNDTFTLA